MVHHSVGSGALAGATFMPADGVEELALAGPVVTAARLKKPCPFAYQRMFVLAHQL